MTSPPSTSASPVKAGSLLEPQVGRGRVKSRLPERPTYRAGAVLSLRLYQHLRVGGKRV